MTCSNPPLPSLILSNCARKMEKLNWITIRISFPRLRASGIVSTSTVSTSFCRNHFVYSVILGSELSGVFSPKYATCGPTTYSTWVRTDVLFDIRILKTIGHGKNRLYKRKLEIATRSSYTWVKPMSELWRFVYIESHVTLHAKADAQKVNSKRPHDQANMSACKPLVLLLSVVGVCYLASPVASEQNCSVENCKVLPVGEDLESEFRLKASEKGVRLIYLNLKIGNSSYNPLDLPDEILPTRWMWARSINEPMLSLPFDFDVLSLGLLNYQVRSMTVSLRDEPSGCLAGLNSTCQNMAVGRALLDNVTRDSSIKLSRKTGVVCVIMIEKKIHSDYRSIKYHCCGFNVSRIYCDFPVVKSNWFNAIHMFLFVLSNVVLFYSPALLLLLPDCIVNLKSECASENTDTENQQTNSEQADSTSWPKADGNHQTAENQNEEVERDNGEELRTAEGNQQTRENQNEEVDRDNDEELRTADGNQPTPENQNEEVDRDNSEELPVDDANPVTCSTLLLRCAQQLPGLKMSFNLKLAVLLFCIYPFPIYLELGLYLSLKPKYIHERLTKVPLGTGHEIPEFSFFFTKRDKFYEILYLILVILTFLMAILFLRPRDLFLQKETICFVCKVVDVFFPDVSIHAFPPTQLNQNHVTVGEKMLQHMKMLQEVVYLSLFQFCYLQKEGLKKLLSLSCYLNGSFKRALSILFLLFYTLYALFLSIGLGAFCLFLRSVLLIFGLEMLSPLGTVYFFSLVKIYSVPNNFASPSLRISLCMIIGSYLGFFIAALFILAADWFGFICSVLGFTIMGLVLNVEIVTPYVAFLIVVITNVYFCYANFQRSYMEVKGYILKYWQQESDTTDSGEQNTIPENLFWSVSNQVLPVKNEICRMFGHIAVILIFLFLTISSIIFFGNEYDISTLVSTIAVFISGAIPSLFFKGLTGGKNLVGWRKIKLEREIKKEVKNFRSERGRGGINSEHNEREEERSAQNNNNMTV